ncbi:hypothetical protein [Maribacter sp. 2308TA10-17]|uniref:hypothetical protein n=1 Tax=Maribacter sp. 2308TA10-17 TaxID=3386276 RepID=UPI0039BD7609
MKNLRYFLCLTFLLAACAKKESEGPCIGIIDFVGPPSFQLTFIDQDENNLIENGHFDSNLISASINGFLYENQIVDFDTPNFENKVILPTGLGNEGKNTWILRLSESEIDTLVYSLVLTEVKQDGFCGTESFVTTASFNGNAIDLGGSNGYDLLINKSIE